MPPRIASETHRVVESGNRSSSQPKPSTATIKPTEPHSRTDP